MSDGQRRLFLTHFGMWACVPLRQVRAHKDNGQTESHENLLRSDRRHGHLDTAIHIPSWSAKWPPKVIGQGLTMLALRHATVDPF